MLIVLGGSAEFSALVTEYTPEGLDLLFVESTGQLTYAVAEHGAAVSGILLGPDLEEEAALDLAADLHLAAPEIAVILARNRAAAKLLRAAMRVGVVEVLSGTYQRADHVSAVEHASEETALRRGRSQAGGGAAPRGELITVFSSKGGCGKSMVATNIATLLNANTPGEVVLLDLDLESGDDAVLLQLLPQWTIHDAAQRVDGLDAQQLRGFLTEHPSGLQVLAAPLRPEQAGAVSGPIVARILELLRAEFRFVIVDGPSAFTDPVLAALDEADRIIVLASLDVPSIKGMRTTLMTLNQLGIQASRIRRVLNRADSKVGLTVREVERSLGAPIDVTIPSSRDVPRSVNQGTPLSLLDPGSPVVRAISELLDFRTTGTAPKVGASAPTSRPRLFGRRGGATVNEASGA